MATTSDGPQANYQNERGRLKEPDAWGISEADAELILSFLDALDPDEYNSQPGEIGTKSYSTLEAYAQNLRLTAKAADGELRTLTAGELNDVFSEMGEKLKANTVQQRQSSARVFYRYHDHLDVDPEQIYIVKNEPSEVDPRDLFDREEIDAMREAIDNPRDRLIIELAFYTGQRIRVMQTLRVKDVEPKEGRFYLNPDAIGLKGAKGMRPLLVAEQAAQEWMDYHPASDDPEAYFITALPDAARGDPTKTLYQSTINRRIEAAAEEAGIRIEGYSTESRAHAHNLRHSFVQWGYVKKEMDLSTIKWMMGHAKDSRTLEETYFNILDRDHAEKAKEAAGVAEPKEEEDETPDVCPDRHCNYPLPAGAKACPRCGTVITADAKATQEQMQEQAESQIPEVENEQEARAVQAVLKELRENPADAVDE